jgi:phosphoribosyl-ATP pyrophosphohydrolase/phosphoribosyl-AMP cyclohydrolase
MDRRIPWLSAVDTIAGAVEDAEISFDPNGLVPCIAQDVSTGEVLMLAWANEESIRLTEETGELHFHSRSRNEIWHKGATSGNTMAVRAMRVDCDGDAVVALVEPAGPACHTGERTCFHSGQTEVQPGFEVLAALQRTVNERDTERPEGSWTTKLLTDPALAGAKVEEEAEEVVRAAREESDGRVSEEAADVLYHLIVLLRSRGLQLDDAIRVLAERMGD